MHCTETNILSSGDIITIFGIVVNLFLARWLIKTLQNNLTNKRYLKDHLICEIKELRLEYRKFLNDLYYGKLKPKNITPWFKLMNIKTQDIMDILERKYEIDIGTLKTYQIELRNLVTEQKEFNENYRENKNIILEDLSLKELLVFQQKNNSKFNTLIIDINEK
jgi:hypothetical protein